MNKTNFIFLFFTYFFSMLSAADDLALVKIGEATLERSGLHIMDASNLNNISPNEKKQLSDVIGIIRADFSFYKKKFELIDSNVGQLPESGDPIWDNLKNLGIRYLVRVKFADNRSWFKVETFDSATLTKITDTTIRIGENTRSVAHTISDHIYRQIFKKPSIFLTRILFVSDLGSRGRNIVKELYIMDFDGERKTKLTDYGGTVISPAISHDLKYVLFSLIKNETARNRNLNLYLTELESGKTNMISSQSGINSGAVFTADGKKILLTLSHLGNAEIFEMDLEGKNLRRITNHYGADVDPSITNDGSIMSFLSDRPGMANIYTADPSATEKDVKRISFVGEFNATPRFSPDGKQIVFSSWMDNRFDIFRIDSTGHNLSRLTKNFGSNEDPSYSNDGEFIAFSSQKVISRKEAVKKIYIMDKDGEIIKSITDGYGNCITPRWSN